MSLTSARCTMGPTTQSLCPTGTTALHACIAISLACILHIHLLLLYLTCAEDGQDTSSSLSGQQQEPFLPSESRYRQADKSDLTQEQSRDLARRLRTGKGSGRLLRIYRCVLRVLCDLSPLKVWACDRTGQLSAEQAMLIMKIVGKTRLLLQL
jgi:hypothetical protein